MEFFDLHGLQKLKPQEQKYPTKTTTINKILW